MSGYACYIKVDRRLIVTEKDTKLVSTKKKNISAYQVLSYMNDKRRIPFFQRWNWIAQLPDIVEADSGRFKCSYDTLTHWRVPKEMFLII